MILLMKEETRKLRHDRHTVSLLIDHILNQMKLSAMKRAKMFDKATQTPVFSKQNQIVNCAGWKRTRCGDLKMNQALKLRGGTLVITERI